MRNDILIRLAGKKDYCDIIRLVLSSFEKGTDYSDGTDVLALIEEIKESEYYLPELTFVAVFNDQIVGFFMFSRFPLSPTEKGGHRGVDEAEMLMLGPVAVHPDFFRVGIGTTMLTMGLEKAKQYRCKGILVEGNNHFYNRFGFVTSENFGIKATCGLPLKEPRYLMCMEVHEGSLNNTSGYVVYDMYYNA